MKIKYALTAFLVTILCICGFSQARLSPKFGFNFSSLDTDLDTVSSTGRSGWVVGMDLRLRLIRSLMSAEWEFFTGSPTGYFSNAISSEAHRAAMGYREACAALAGLIQVAVYATFVVLISWKVALASIVGSADIQGLRVSVVDER